MMGVAASGKRRILITMRFKGLVWWAQRNKGSARLRGQAQGRRASEKRSELQIPLKAAGDSGGRQHPAGY